MSFPRENSVWPPEDFRYWDTKVKEWAAWYSGDPTQLLHFYGSQYSFPDTDWGRFWATVEREERANALHLPAAGDIASTSADLIFSEAPNFNYEQTTVAGRRISSIIENNGILSLLLEAAEMSAALSGVFLKIDIDPTVLGEPIISVITPLNALPFFKWGRLWKILFYRTVLENYNSNTVWRLFELRRRENAQLLIEYKLYKGSRERVGREMSLDSLEETANLGLEDVQYKMEGLGCVYIPNKLPNRLFPGSPLGINDYAGVITLMDSLDFTWSSLMREIELGMAQLLVDEELLQNPDGIGNISQDTRGGRLRFNKFQKAFIKLNMSPWRLGQEKSIKPVEQIQFDLRVDDHLKTCESLFNQIITLCGYSPQTFGLVESGTTSYSGTALRIRERKSLLTREKKSRYWQPALFSLFRQLQQMDIASGLSTYYQPEEVNVELQDSIILDEKDQSETLRNLDQAKAISTYQKVKRLHPEWAEEVVEEEISRILDEQGARGIPFDFPMLDLEDET